MPWSGGEFRRTCKTCNRERRPDEAFSARGKCPACGKKRIVSSAIQMRMGAGPFYETWRRGMARSIGVILPEDRQP